MVDGVIVRIRKLRPEHEHVGIDGQAWRAIMFSDELVKEHRERYAQIAGRAHDGPEIGNAHGMRSRCQVAFIPNVECAHCDVKPVYGARGYVEALESYRDDVKTNREFLQGN